MKPRLGTHYSNFIKTKDDEKEREKGETETTKEKSETKGDK